MSQKNQAAKRVARERAAAERARQQQQQRRRRQWITAAIVLVVIAAVVGIGVAVKASKSSSSAPFAAPNGSVIDQGVNAKTNTSKPTAIAYGSPDAKVTVTVFEDVRCPFCDIFELGARQVYKKYVDAGEVRVMFHLVKLIDVNDAASGQNATGSRTGGSALACAQQAGMFDAYHDVLYDNQPAETSDPFSDPLALITLAKKVPGLDTATFESCVKGVKYGGFVDQNWADFNTLGLQGTPTVIVAGATLTNTQLFSASSTAGLTANTRSDGQGANTTAIDTAFQAAVTKAYGSATPSPWASASPTPTASATG